MRQRKFPEFFGPNYIPGGTVKKVVNNMNAGPEIPFNGNPVTDNFSAGGTVPPKTGSINSTGAPPPNPKGNGGITTAILITAGVIILVGVIYIMHDNNSDSNNPKNKNHDEPKL